MDGGPAGADCSLELLALPRARGRPVAGSLAPWNLAEMIIDNGDGTYTIEINFGDDPIVETLDEKHLLFTGSGFTPIKLFQLCLFR